MKLIDLTCPHCSAHLQVNAENKRAVCEYCGTTILIDDEVQHIQYDNAEEAGYNFEKGRQRAQAEAQQQIQYSPQQYSQQPKKKRRTWLWVLGWIFIFPLPLTILLLRKKTMKPVLKYGIIAAAWILYFIMAASGSSNNNNEGGRSTNTPSSSEATTASDISTPTEKTTEPVTSITEVPKESNIKSFSFVRKDTQTVKVGKSTSESYVTVKVKDKKSFSPDDVLFVSDNPEIATIEFTKDVSTTLLYYKITGVSAGETYVYASSKDGSITSDRIKVVVEGSGSNITAINFSSQNSITLKQGQETDGNVKVTLKNSWEYSEKDVVFVSENPEIATISFVKSSSGKTVYYKIVAVKPGETKVYAQSNDGLITSEKITVVVPEPVEVESVSLESDNMTLALGQTATLKALIAPTNADDQSIKWSSSDTSKATIDQNGNLTAISMGDVTITAEAANGKSASLTLTVDGTKRVMKVQVSHRRTDDVNIGDEWTYYNEINGQNAGREYIVTAGETLTFHAKYIESDANPDVGEVTKTYTVTEDDIKNGFTFSMELDVTENGGSNSGKSAHFVIIFTFSGK